MSEQTTSQTDQWAEETVDKVKKKESDDKKSSDKKKNNLIVLTTKPISEIELRDKLNKEFGKNNQYYNVLKEAVDTLTEVYKSKLKNMILLIKEGVKPDFRIVDGEVKSVEFKRKLTNDELENFVISIPVELFFIQEIMDDRALDMDLSSQLKDFHITEKILEIHGGTEKERMRAAEYNSMMPIFTSIIKNRVYYNLKNEMDQASKVYDALKRVIQLRITEMQTFGRSSEYGSPKHTVRSEREIAEEINPELSNYVITIKKYPDGITVKDLFFEDKGYFNWIKNKKDATGLILKYQEVIKEFEKALSNEKVIS